MMKFIGPLYHLLQHLTHHCLWLDTLDFWPQCINPLCLESSLVKVTLWLMVSQSVSGLVSSAIWGSWPDISSCLTVTVLSAWGALSDERMGHVCQGHSCSRKSVVGMFNIFTFYTLSKVYIQHILGLCRSRLSTVDHALSSVAPSTTAV
jgi:hypothetical protein